MEARLLGTGGWLSNDRRETSCVLVRSGADALALDAGTGFRRLVTEPELLSGVERLHVVLSHFHLDHTVGLLALPDLAHGLRCHVWASGSLYGEPAEELVRRLLGYPFLMPETAELAEMATVHELNGTAELGPFRVETRVQPRHVGPTLAVKVDGWLAYCTDTAYDEGNVDFVRGARVLLHEAMYAADETDDPAHAAAGEAARIADASGVENLVLVHVAPRQRDDEELAGYARARFAASEVGRDGASV